MLDSSTPLPSELWIKILEKLDPRPDSDVGRWKSTQSSFLALPLVCRGFRDIFCQQTAWGRHLLLDKETPRVEACLVSMLQTRFAETQTLEIPVWSETVQACLIAFADSRSLVRLIARPATQPELKQLTTFRALTSCHFKASHAALRILNLRPLQGLPRLTSLKLDAGVYHNLDAASQLTQLHLEGALTNSIGHCHFVSSLRSLKMANSTLGRMHNWGLLGCTSLQSLHLGGSCSILADNECAILRTDAGLQCHIPAVLMHHLMSLTNLYFHAYTGIHHDHLADFCCIASLNRLELCFPADATICSAKSWAALHLTSLSICSSHDDVRLSILLQWQDLKLLKHITIACAFTSDKSLLGIAKLTGLKTVCLVRAHATDSTTTEMLDELLQRLASLSVLLVM